MAKSSIDKLNLLLKENKRYDIIFSFLKAQHNKKELYSCILSKLQSFFKDKYSISIINNIIKLLYKLYNDESFNCSLLTKGELYYLSKIYKIYSDYVEESKYDIDENIKNKTMELSSKINETIDIDNNPSYKLYFKLEQLDKSIEELNNHIATLIKTYHKKKEVSTIDESSILNEVLLIIESINKDLIHLEHEALKNTVDNEFITYLETVINKINVAQGEYKNLKIEIENYQKMCADATNEETIDKEFKRVVLEKICTSSCTLQELNQYLESFKIFMSNDEVYKRLNELNNKINIIDQSHPSLPSYYKVCEPLYETSQTFKMHVPDYKKELELLLISDLHIGSVSEDIYDLLYNLYEYAINNNISTILNLGDLCSLSNFDIGSKKALLEAEKLIEEIIVKYPKDDNISNLVMGGNHDKSLFIGGIDPIKRICLERLDFKNLGYDDAIIDIGNNDTSNYIVLHHPSERVGDNSNILTEIADIKRLLKKFYADTDLSPDNNLMDFYGHFHKSLLDTASGICVVPSLSKDRYMNGAWHLKLYFDKDMKITYMVLIPIISIEKKLIPSQSIVYQKKLKKF